jgi:hypothetical protein
LSLFGPLDVRLDPWAVEYGSELPLGAAADDEPQLDVDPEVERPRGEWEPLAPAAEAPAPARLVFVDGVRRIEARVLVRHGATLGHGAFGSFGVGAVVCENGRTAIVAARAERVLALGAGLSLPDSVRVSPALAYEPLSTAETKPEAPLGRLQEAMRAAEEALAQRLAGAPDTLVVCDGPLRPSAFAGDGAGTTVGYVKRLFETYLDAELLRVVARLPPGARTPLFALRAPRRFARLAWFLRLGAPHPGDHDLAGLVRLEVRDGVGLEAARGLADATARLLPRFAPSFGRDPRAPQNLLPIGALERHLLRLLGDARVVRRHIEALLRAPRRAEEKTPA